MVALTFSWAQRTLLNALSRLFPALSGFSFLSVQQLLRPRCWNEFSMTGWVVFGITIFSLHRACPEMPLFRVIPNLFRDRLIFQRQRTRKMGQTWIDLSVPVFAPSTVLLPSRHSGDLLARILSFGVPLFGTPIWDLVLIILGMECLLAEGKCRIPLHSVRVS